MKDEGLGMDVNAAVGGASPTATYSEKLAQLRNLQDREQRRERAFGYAKLGIAALTLTAGGLLIHHTSLLGAVLALVAIFLVLSVLQEKLLNRIRHRGRAVAYYERGLSRINGEWKGSGETGERYLREAHVYARDLDVFGDASLFQYLCTVRTRTGEDTLARWLLEPANVEEISAREEAVRDLASRLNFRERLASAGEAVRNAVDPRMLAAWGESKPIFTSAETRVVTTVLALAWVGGIVAWALTGLPYPAMLLTLVNFAYAHRIFARLDRAAGAIEKAADDLKVLAEVLGLMEQERFEAPKLQAMKAALRRGGRRPSTAIRRLARLAEIIESRHSLFARPLDLVLFWSAQLVFVAENWQRECGPAIRGWLHQVGELEALASIAAFAFEHPEYTFPVITGAAACFEAEGLAHPLLPATETVENDVGFGPEKRLMILSGPNMAGKSTFIRSVGVNAVLAQCGAPVRARRLRMSTLRVAASICILDSLSGGVSRFYAEIRRVKMITDLSDGAEPVLFLFDELLSGTNSHDRLVGTQFVLRHLVERGAIGIVSTHDLALTKIADAMEGQAFNAHFEDRLEDGKLIFDYKLKPGIVQTSNALDLMRAIGLGVIEERT